MLRPLIQRSARCADSEHGVTLLLVALAMVSIITMAGLSIDIGTLYQASAEAQRSADAAALAAARVLSASGMTGDPANSSNTWSTTCANATQVAQAVANQNLISGAPPSSVTVTFSANDGSNCTFNMPSGFGVNPIVTVKVSQASLPTYFSRIWGRTGSSASATASAEAFNSASSGTYASGGSIVPVQPRCVKPWMVANYDPLHPAPTGASANNYCDGSSGPGACDPLVNTDGSIKHPGILGANGIIGESFWLIADCAYNQSYCKFRDPVPQANTTKAKHFHAEDPPNVEYLPAQTSFPSVAIPAGGTCSGVSGNYAQAVAGCDQNTHYQCGVQKGNNVDLSENPSPNDTPSGVQCATHQGNGNSGQDTLVMNGLATPPVPVYPFQIQIGSNNPLKGAGAGGTDIISNSTSIMTLPIYDSTMQTFTAGGVNQVTVIGFLQVFVDAVDQFGNVGVTVMNITSCGTSVPAGAAALTGTSPVPVRLITPP